MKKSKIIILSLTLAAISCIGSAFNKPNGKTTKSNLKSEEIQTINMFVSHGHCCTPFAGRVDNLKLDLTSRNDAGNPIENMRISFDIDPNSFNVCAKGDLTNRIKTPGLFSDKNNEKISFQTRSLYTVGIDWYQLNGLLSIKGIEKNFTFFISGIRNPNHTWPTTLVLEGQLDLFDWGIDYDKIVFGNSNAIPTKIMRFNMKINMNKWIPISPKVSTK